MGNFIADAVKGTVLDAYQDDIQKGIRMHRSIDFYTDRHPFTCRSKDRLRAEFKHYSGVNFSFATIIYCTWHYIKRSANNKMVF